MREIAMAKAGRPNILVLRGDDISWWKAAE
jgi:hypothetical protein